MAVFNTMLALPLIDDNRLLNQYIDTEVHIFCLPFLFLMIIADLHSGVLNGWVQLQVNIMPSVKFHLDVTGVQGLPLIYLLSSFRPIELPGRY
jgi:hypothetical protein